MTLKLHHLRPAPGAKTAKTRVGRGEGSKGKTAGRGTKGTGSRYQVPPNFEGGALPLHMRLPKLKGFKSPFRVEFQVVNLDRLGELFPDGGQVTPADLVRHGRSTRQRPGQDPRRWRGQRCAAGQRTGLLVVRTGQDHRRRRQRDRALTVARLPVRRQYRRSATGTIMVDATLGE